jgi:nucleotide-binding universal stress UspA family protein
MYSQLLVPLDGTPDSSTALVTARGIARKLGAEVTLLRVVPTAAREGSEVEALDDLSRAAAGLRSGGVTVHTEVRRGEPVGQILAVAERCHLIVVAGRDRGRLGRMLRSGVVERLIAAAPAPVLVLRLGGHRATSLRALLVPVDGTHRDALALGAAIGLARDAGARLVMVRAVVPVSPCFYAVDVYGGPSAIPYIDAETDEDALRGARTYVDGLVALVARAGVEARGCAVAGPAAEAIVEVADGVDADLIVMCTRGRTGPTRVLLGSVADRVRRAAHQGVVLIGRDARVAAAREIDIAATSA